MIRIALVSIPVAPSIVVGVCWCGMILCIATSSLGQSGDEFKLSKRSIVRESDRPVRRVDSVQWEPKKTAVIVCDVWDYHHSINAVRRLEEMLPSMDKLLRVARDRGSIVIHAPSDCMPYYAGHPARVRAEQVPKGDLPPNIASWNSKVPSEEHAIYPLDQSDGGEDDDPQEHRQWSDKLKSLGRDPGLPWKAQNPALSIEGDKDYISDRGDEVWSILKSNRIEHVIMIGVHTNMCVVGRPFGIRQLASRQIDTVLVRDLTDCMYNPKRWPYLDHFTGNDLMIGYVEEHLCPTITSDQIIGGAQVVFSKDTRVERDLMSSEIERISQRAPEWQLSTWKKLLDNASTPPTHSLIVRCSIRIPQEVFTDPVTISHPRIKKAWLNGHALVLSKNSSSLTEYQMVASQTFGNDDANLLVLEIDTTQASQNPQVTASDSAPIVMSKSGAVTLSGGLQSTSRGSPSDTNLPLPAKFALPPAVFYTLPDL